MSLLRKMTEGLARKTTRRGLIGRGADVAFGVLAGAAAGAATRVPAAIAGDNTVCAFPGRPCECIHCQENGVCGKPCVINTTWYASGCWTTGAVTCCDCTCPRIDGGPGSVVCGCGSDYHNNPTLCP
jgi:hypothetical protein